MKKLTYILFILLLVFSLGGCTKIAEHIPGQSETASGDDVVLTGDGYELVFVCPFRENEYWDECIKGIERADRKFSTHTTVIGPQNIDNFPDDVPGYVEKAIEMHPDGIFLYAGLESLYPLIEKATAEGIPVVAIDSDAPDSSRIAYVGTNLPELGNNAGRVAIEMVGKSAKIGYVCTSESALNEQVVFNAFKDIIADYGVEYVATTEGGGDADVAEKAVEEMITAHPEINVVFCTVAYNGAGAARAKEMFMERSISSDNENENDGSFKLICLDDTKENLEYLEKGIIDALFVQSPEQMGYESVMCLDKYLSTGSIEKTEYTVSSTLVTLDNVDTYNMGAGSSQATNRTVTIGYYGGDDAFQCGADDSARKSGYAYEYYQALAPIAGWRYEYVYGPRSEIIDKLTKGEVDIVAGVYKTNLTLKQMIFSKRDIGLAGIKRYFAVNNKSPEIAKELDYAMVKLLQMNPEFTITLAQKYYSSTTMDAEITDIERNYLDEKSVITLGYVRDNMPFCDEESGKATGLVSTIADMFNSYMQVDVKTICFDSMEELEAAVRTDNLDVAFPVYSDTWVNEQKGLRQTTPFINDRMIIVYQGFHSEDILDSVALSVAGMGQKDFMAAHYPESEFTYYNSRYDAFEAVRKGNNKCVMGSSNVIQMFLSQHPEYQNMNFVYTDAPEEIGMAVNDKDSLLAGIINKAINSTDDAVISDALFRYSSIPPVYTLRAMIQNNALPLVIMISAFSLTLLLLFIGYFRKSRIFNEQQKLTNEALEQALVAANSANQAKTRFLSSMSHDIRTPMNAIIGMTTVATAHIDDKNRVKDCLEKIARSGKYLITLINDVLDISKIESGNIVLSPVIFSIKEAFETLVNVVKPEAQEKNIRITANIHDIGHEMLLADEVRINQIYINILNNAVKYTLEGGTVSVELFEEILSEGDRAKITYIVSDNGIGMSDEFMLHMYDTFSRADDSKVGKIQGTGLGLSIVKQMVDIMNGTIDCESVPGKGTKFTICLELPLANDIKETNVTIKREISNLHLLVAEDYELNWEVIHELLGMHDITADWVKNGQECVDAICNAEPNTYDLILMDIQMPVMNGREATKLIRADERDYVKNIPIIAMTADAFAEDIADSISAGMNGHLSKPVDMDVMLQEISKVLGIGGG